MNGAILPSAFSNSGFIGEVQDYNLVRKRGPLCFLEIMRCLHGKTRPALLTIIWYTLNDQNKPLISRGGSEILSKHVATVIIRIRDAEDGIRR